MLTWTRDNKPPESASSSVQPSRSLTASVDTEEASEGVAVASLDNNINSDLEDVNKRVEQARNELATETLQRDELKGRVDSLQDSMSRMESLISQRESELNELQEEVELANNAKGEGSDTSADNIAAFKEQQDAIERQADAEKNLATAEAEAQAVRLSTEEDALRAQLAALQIEKRNLEAASELEKADLVRQAELEKIRLLAQAETEQQRIKAELETEKARITSEASAEVARIRQNSDTENQRLLAEAEAERERLVNETAEMRAELQTMEAEKSRLLAQAQQENIELQKAAEEQARVLAAAEAEQTRLQAEAEEQTRLTAAAEAERQAAEAERQAAADESSRVKDRLAKLQEETDAKQAEMALAAAEVAKEANDSDADGSVMNEAKDAGKAMAAGGAAAVGGLLGFAPLQEIIGERKNVLGVGAVLSFLGLLGAWAIRRRSRPAPEVARRPRADQQRSNRQAERTNFDNRSTLYEDDAPAQTRRGPSAAAAAATAGAAAGAAAGTVSARQMQDEASMQPTPELRNEPELPTEAASPTEEESALDDTITEAEVYLRYGLHGQAEDLLKTAIERSPDNEEYHFKLLENYHDQKNASAFENSAASFREKFSSSAHLSRIDEMANEITPDSSLFGPSVATTGVVGASVASSIVAAKKVKADSSSALNDIQNPGADGANNLDFGDTNSGNADPGNVDMGAGINNDLDQTIDPGTEFNMDELEATGNLGALMDESVEFEDQGNMSLDDVDLASLDDDGTLNLEEVVGSQMSGVDLGTLDLTNPDHDSTLDSLTLDDADLNDLGDVAADVTGGLDSDISVEGVAPAGVGGSDEMETMLDLAKAYIDMGDQDSAASALKDIVARGNPMQKNEASELLKKLT